ncbi:anthrax toxin receptor 1-like [Myxocyprinus asiaticus]|uniref:anthrax toxin receptor 1-like n=1 Tax=Myxocyprinus asiaticus TaxID=70543 RepID=UPI0022217870|nr:anthrax toxin receptor 1-like [Myxocyprinus asiaticus]
MLGILMPSLHAGKAEPYFGEEKRSCQGAFDLYFVLDKDDIAKDLNILRREIPGGDTYTNLGLEKPEWNVVYFTGTASVIIALTDGELNDYQFVTAQQEVQRARSVGAIVYCVGVKDFNQTQLASIADTNEHVFPVIGGFQALEGMSRQTNLSALSPKCVVTERPSKDMLKKSLPLPD